MKTNIKTPDQRLRVFVSSTLKELSDERLAAKEAILALNLIPVMFELGARPYAPRDLYTAYLQQSHIFLGVYWQSYGWVAPDMEISGLEDEFILSGNMPRLIYLKESTSERAPDLERMISTIQSSEVSYKTFKDAEELKKIIINDLAVLIMERFELSMNNDPAAIESDVLNESFPIPSSTLIGREKEINEILQLMHEPNIRLITLSGTGGIGKTRVSLEVISKVKNEGNYKVCFVPLATLDQAEKVPDAILRTAFPLANSPMPPIELLKALMRDKKIFLVLDNFEHLIEARMVVSNLLEHCAHLKILITSRELLHISGEYEFDLPPLGIGEKDKPMPASGDLSPAIQLFIQRTVNIHPDFKLTETNYRAIREICESLDGIPLAIELAAARTRLLSPPQIAKLLKSNLDVLKSGAHDIPARHQTLRATVEWSFNLLSEEEQDLLCMLSVFSGGATLEAAAYVGVDHNFSQSSWEFPRSGFFISEPVFNSIHLETSEIEFLEAAESLLSKSLAFTSVNKSGSLRINFYQTIRHYCFEKLKEKGVVDLTQYRHLVYYLYLAEGSWYNLKSEEAETAYEMLDNDIYNIENALLWASKNEPLLGIRLSVAMAEYWDTRGNFKDTLKWIEKMMAQLPDLSKKHFEISCIARFELSRALFRLADFDKAWQIIEVCLIEAKAQNNAYLIVDCLIFKSLINVYASRIENKSQNIKESIDRARELQYEMALLEGLQHNAADRIFNGPVEEGIPFAEESLSLAKKLKATRWEVISLIFLGFGYQSQGLSDKSVYHFKKALQLSSKLSDQILPVYSLLGLCQNALYQQKMEMCCLLMAAIDTFIKKPGTSLVPMVIQIHSAIMEQLNKMPEDQRSALMDKGCQMKLNDAIQLALEDEYQIADDSDSLEIGSTV